MTEEEGEREAQAFASGYSPKGWLDSVARDGTVRGWACDQDDPTATIAVHLYVNGAAGKGTGIPIVADKSSEPAVAKECSGGRAHRFKYRIPDYRGEYVYAYGINIDGTAGRNKHLKGSPKRTTKSAKGVFDRVEPGGVAVGWACDPDEPNKSIRVHLYVGGKPGRHRAVHNIVADASSSSAVARECGGGTAHRFRFVIPGYRLGEWVYAYGIDSFGFRSMNAHLSHSPERTSTPRPPANICEGKCGDMLSQGCYCDSTCTSYGDCCQNVSGDKGASHAYVRAVCSF